MDKRYIAVLDSGIGGISVLKKLEKAFPLESFLYFGDNKNAPYGNLGKQKLLTLSIHNINILKAYPIKMIVLACNTLSVNIIKEIEDYSNLPVFGIFPPVESCCLSGKKTLLLSTIRTSEKYLSLNNVESIGFFDLASSIEDNLFCLERVNFLSCKTNSKLDLKNCKKGQFETIILGCTHFNFIKKQISDHFQPQNIADGTLNLIYKMQQYIKTSKSLVKTKQNQVLFVGENSKLNKEFYVKSG